MSGGTNLRIALFTDGFFPNVIGGMQKHSYYLAKYLAAAGVSVDLYYPRFEGKQDDFSGFTEEEKSRINFIGVNYPPAVKTPGHYIRGEYEFSRRMYSAYQKNAKPDFIIAKGFTAWELISQKAKGVNLPLVGVNFHGYEMFQRQPNFMSWIKSKLLFSSPVKFNVLNADYVFSYGGKITGIIESLGVNKSHILEIPTGISESWLSAKESVNSVPRKFVFVGRYERRKGIQELTVVLRKLIAARQQFTFDFVGDVPMNKRISSEKINYHGSIRDEIKIREIMRSCDILICPSYSEGMPNVIMEGMASGLAIIATDTGATSVMVSGNNGWLIEPANHAALEQATVNAINIDDKSLEEMKNSSLEKVRTGLLWQQVVGQVITKVSEAIRAPRNSA